MIPNAAPTNELTEQVRTALSSIPDWLDASAKVWLVETAFLPTDGTTYPAHSAAFAALTGGGNWEVEFDAVSGEWFLVQPEPVDGWDFVSTGAGVSIVGYVVELATDTDTKICGNMFENPIAVTAVGQHITIPYVSLPINQMFGTVPIPQPLA